MSARDLIVRAASWVATKATEGAVRPGPWYLPVTGAWLGAQWDMWNFWQCGWSPSQPTRSAIVEACISSYSQTIAMCPGDHWKVDKKGGKERVPGSALARILRYPNEYQSISDFMLNLVHQLYSEGNAYAFCTRNSRFEIDEMHLMRSQWTRPMVGENGEVVYTMGGNSVVARMPDFLETPVMVPARDVLHVRLHTSARQPWPLLGESPLSAVMSEIMTSSSIMDQQNNFYANQARPSAVLQTDMMMDKDAVQALRDRWREMTTGVGAGQTPILTHGLKVQPWGISSKDAQLAEILRLTEQHIALVYRIPLQILGLGGTTHVSASSTEALMRAWIASGLGFALNHIEEAFGRLFQLKGVPDEFLEFDTGALLRSDMKDRVAALKDGVLGGIYAPNEARRLEGLPEVKYGEEPRVQQQVVPLSAAAGIPPAPGPHAAPGAPAPFAPKPPESAPPKPEPSKPSPGKQITSNDIKQAARRINADFARVGRRFS